MYSFCAMYSLRMSFCSVPEICLPVGALLFGDGQIHGPDHRGGRIDGHRSGDVRERNLVEEHFHVRERADGHAAFADFAFGERMIGVVAHQRGQIEGDGEAGLALREQIAEALVGVARRSRSRRTGAWSRGGRDTWWGECRACRAARRASPRSRSADQPARSASV